MAAKYSAKPREVKGKMRKTRFRGLRFDDFDVARVRLICELHYELRIEEDSLSVVLSLLDQLYATRRSLCTLVAAVKAQPADVRARIAGLVKAEP